MEGKSPDSVGTPEKGDFVKPQAPAERKISVRLQLNNLIETKISAGRKLKLLSTKMFYNFEIIFLS